MRKLEIGPGSHPVAGYETLDYISNNNPTYCFDIVKTFPWPIANNTFDEVLAIHVIEHIDRYKIDIVLKETYRILKPNGVLRIHVPNGLILAHAYILHPQHRDDLQMAIYGMEANDESTYAYAHKYLYDFELLSNALLRNNYINVKDVTSQYTDRHDNGWAWLEDKISLKVQGRKREE